jgi:hypothetical protein
VIQVGRFIYNLVINSQNGLGHSSGLCRGCRNCRALPTTMPPRSLCTQGSAEEDSGNRWNEGGEIVGGRYNKSRAIKGGDIGRSCALKYFITSYATSCPCRCSQALFLCHLSVLQICESRRSMNEDIRGSE